MKINKIKSRTSNLMGVSAIVFFVLMLLGPVLQAHTTAPPPPPPPGPFPPQPPCATGPCCDKGGSPKKIVFQSGEETFNRTDMVVNDVYPIRISRTYSSNTIYDSPLGYGWAFNFDKRLFEYPDNSVLIRHGCGNINRYVFTGGAYQPASGSQNNKLVKNADNTFTASFLNGEKDNYDSQGRLTSSVDVRGNKLEFSYDTRGKLPLVGTSPNALDPSKPFIVAYMQRLTRIQVRYANDVLGNSVDIAYNETTGRVTSVTANDGRVVTYEHDVAATNLTKGNLLGVTGLENQVSIYKYEDIVNTKFQDHHNITHIQEGLNATPAIIQYNAQDVAYKESYGRQVFTFNFMLSPFQTTVTETITDINGTNLRNAIHVYQFNDVGFTEFERDALNNETRYTLDAFGNKLKEQIYEGSETTGLLVKLIDRTFDANSNLLTEAVTLNSGEVVTETYTYDGTQKSSKTVVSSLSPAKLFKTEWLYNHDANGDSTTVKEERRYKDNGVDYLLTQYTYNEHGNILTITLPDNHVIVNEYGVQYEGRYITKTYHEIAGVAVADLQEVYTYDATGNRISVTDTKLHTTTTLYDSLNRRKKVTNHLAHITSYVYDDRGNLTQITRDRTIANDQLDITKLTYNDRNLLSSIERTDATGAFVTIKQNTYDSAGQLYTTTNSLGQTNTFNYDLLHRLDGITNYKSESISYTLDVLGNKTHEEVKDSTSVIVRSSDATFDVLNRQLTQIGATNNQTTTYSYDAAGNRISMTDALSRPATQYTYDTLSRLSNVQDANSKNTAYGYHDRGWLQTVTDPRGLVTTYNYNELGQLDNLVSPDTATTIYTYDTVGNKQSKKDARNITATYGYDALNRLTSITYPDATKNVTFTYDLNTNGLGKLSRMTDESGSTQYEYNYWGDLSKETKVINGQTFVTQYAYDTEHRQVGIIYPSGRIVTLTPDANNDLVNISSEFQTTSQTLLSDITYMPFGGIDTATFGNGLALNQDYDADYRLTQQQAGTVYDRTTIYNDVNNITGITNNLDATKSQSFIYDDLDRLVDAAGIYGTQHFEYDEDGNRVVETKNTTLTSNYVYPLTSNKLETISGDKANSYGYDNNGNTITKSGMMFSYDNANRMSEAVNGAVTANYKYDGKGQRVVKTVDGVTTFFIFDKDGRLIAEADGAGVGQRDYVYFAGRPVVLAATVGAHAVYYYHVDHLGTPQVLTNQSQGVVWAGDYDAFGEVSLTSSVVESNLRFPGQYFDGETGLHYNYFRDYDTSIGRYVVSDPIGLDAGINTYVYVGSNPIVSFDTYGLILDKINGVCIVVQGYADGVNRDLIDYAYNDFYIKTGKARDDYSRDEKKCVKAYELCMNDPSGCPPPTPEDCDSRFNDCVENARNALNIRLDSADEILKNRLKNLLSDVVCGPDIPLTLK